MEHVILTGETQITDPSANLLTTYLMWASPGLKLSLYHKRLATDCLSHGMPQGTCCPTDALTKPNLIHMSVTTASLKLGIFVAWALI